MMISSRGRYALRVMLDMAKQHSTQNISVRDLAARQNISRKYLESIMNMLCKSELVESATGKTGGYKLRRAPEEYTVGEILQAVEGDLEPIACLTEGSKKCEGAGSCYILPFWQGLKEHIDGYVNSYTLKTLLDEKEQTNGCRCGTEGKDESHEG